MSDMQPLLQSTTTVVTQDVPDNIEAVQATIPNIAQVAGVIDRVLRRLSEFGISQTIPIPFNPITLEFDLGIDYAPDEPFDDTIWELGDSLEGMPEELRSLEQDLGILTEDLELLTANVETASGDIERVNEEIAQFLPIIDEYLIIVSQINDSLLSFKSQISSQLEMLKTVLIAVLVLLSLTQLAPLYLGWELLSGQRTPINTQEDNADASPPKDTEETAGADKTLAAKRSKSAAEKVDLPSTARTDPVSETDQVAIIAEAQDSPTAEPDAASPESPAASEESSPTPGSEDDVN
jgi:hypothetical protein